MSEPAETTETAPADGGQKQEPTFTQADLDKFAAKVRGEERRKASEQYADYDDVKSKAGTLEDRLGTLESELATTRAEALRTGVAAKFGISTEKGANGEPSDADLFLTGTDESTLTAQAERLTARETDRKKQGNVAPREGATDNSGDANSDARNFARNLFGGSD